MKAKVNRLSICDCGFPLFNDSVKLGDEYEIDRGSGGQGQVTCGGCGIVIPVNIVWAETTKTGGAGFLPDTAFDI